MAVSLRGWRCAVLRQSQQPLCDMAAAAALLAQLHSHPTITHHPIAHPTPDTLDAREAQRVARGKLAGPDGAQVGAHLQSVGWQAAQGEDPNWTGKANHATVQQCRWYSALQQCTPPLPCPALPCPTPKSPAAQCSWWGLRSTPLASPAQSACMQGDGQRDACMQRDMYVAHASWNIDHATFLHQRPSCLATPTQPACSPAAPGPRPPRPPVAGWGRVGAGVPGHRAQLLIHLPPLFLVQPAAHLQGWQGELLNPMKAGTVGTPLAAPANRASQCL